MLCIGHSTLPLLASQATQRRTRSILLQLQIRGRVVLPFRRLCSSQLLRHSTLLWRRGNMLRRWHSMLTLVAP